MREPGCGLVEQQQPWTRRERARDLDPLQRSVGQPNRGPGREAGEPEPLEQDERVGPPDS